MQDKKIIKLMDIKRETVYLASLLRGVGKLLFYLKGESRTMSMGNGTYAARFAESHMGQLGAFFASDEEWEVLTGAATNPSQEAVRENLLAECVNDGERLSQGVDAFGTTTNYRRDVQLVPIMASVRSNGNESHLHSKLCKMQLDESLFPTYTASDGPAERQRLLNAFEADFNKITTHDLRSFSETLLNLLQVYASSVPCMATDMDDVSLYDQVRTAAAIAVCLYDVRTAGGDTKEPFLLIGADFSGIQPYIYQIVSKYAGKNLKGRSFYIRLLSDVVVRHIARSLRLLDANVIYNSGGGFYMLAPNTPFVATALDKAVAEIERHMLDAHGTSLYVAIDKHAFAADTLLHRQPMLSEVWARLFVKRDKRKQTKWCDVISRDYDRFFAPDTLTDPSAIDAVTGELFLKGEKKFALDSNANMFMKDVTRQQIKLGETLRQTDAVVMTDQELDVLKGYTHVEPLNLGLHYYFVSRKDLSSHKEALDRYKAQVTVCTYNGQDGDCCFISPDGCHNTQTLNFYGGNEQATKHMATFEKMCDGEQLNRLGVLRMDVDNLGLIFQGGLDPRRATLSHYAALSRAFDIFFSGYINTLWGELAPAQTFILYSGGDDLFIVGRWDKTIEMAEQIQADFKRYGCHNPAFSISGGIAIVPPKFPLMKAAALSADEESRAKGHVCGNTSKDAVSLLSMALHWKHEYPAVHDLKDAIVEALGQGVPKSFISKVLQHASNAQIKNHRVTNVKEYWMLTYDLSRMKQRCTAAKQLVDCCLADMCNNSGKLQKQDIQTTYHPLELWALACRWAEIETRTNL